MNKMLYGLSVFSGIGGIELALHEEVKTIAYVEKDPYAQAVLIKNMQEGELDMGPIYDDVRTFPNKQYRGKVDIIFGGFPCQDISTAGKGAGIKEGTRSGLFLELIKVISQIRPTFVFLENVSAITRNGGDTVLGELTKAGYNCRWTTIQASDVGAPHRRDRWFCLAHTSGDGWATDRMPPTESSQRQTQPQTKRNSKMAHTYCSRQQTWRKFQKEREEVLFDRGSSWCQDPAELKRTSKSFVGRVAYGIPQRVDRLKCLGNAVVPQQGRLAWKILTCDII